MANGLPMDAAALKEEVAGLLRELGTAIGAEFGALRARDVDALEAIVAQKTAIVSALEAASGKICRLDRSTLAAEFGDLEAPAQACLIANRVNGGAIELNRNLVERLLDTMRGTPRSIPVYDASGRLHRRTAGRQMGRV